MFSPIRCVCFNDDRQTFTIVLPSQYRIFRCDPFGMIFSRDCDDLSLGTAATYSGYRFIGLTGSPSPSTFNSKCIRVFDHQTGQVVFDHAFSDHVLTLALGNETVVCAMHRLIEVWNSRTNQLVHTFETGVNVHVPLSLSKDSKNLITAGSNAKQVTVYKGIGYGLKSHSFVADEGAVSVTRFSDNCQYFATAGFTGNSIRVWDLLTMNCVAILERSGKGDIIQSMDFSPTCEYFASCSKNGTVRVYDIRRKVTNASKADAPVCTLSLAPEVYMPRVCWLASDLLGVATLEGDYYRLAFNGQSLEKEVTAFLKRGT